MSGIARYLLSALCGLGAGQAQAWDDSRLSVPVMVNGHIIPYPVFAIFVMPGSPIEVGFVDALGGATVNFGGREMDVAEAQLKAGDEPGLQVMEIRNTASGEAVLINVFTKVPATMVDRNGWLNGYRIDKYPDKPLKGLDIYLPPDGFVEVTPENFNTAVSPNFILGEFVAKQASAYPKYLLLRSSLLLKLENVLAALNQSGHPTEDFVIMSGYRTPFYNRAIGNVPYSRHVWGGAADIYIDHSPADGRMDDLNGDGKVNRSDAVWLANFINDMSVRGTFGPRIGGLGVYGATSAHGPYVHVDVRGTRARW